MEIVFNLNPERIGHVCNLKRKNSPVNYLPYLFHLTQRSCNNISPVRIDISVIWAVFDGSYIIVQCFLLPVFLSIFRKEFSCVGVF